jgi:hypothetical protein
VHIKIKQIMKKNTLLIILSVITIAVQAQNKINYEILKNDPSNIPWIVANLDLAGMDVNYSDKSFGLTFGIGLWGQVEIPETRLITQYSFYRSYFSEGQILQDKDYSQTTDLQLGVAYLLTDRTRNRDLSVGLSSKVIGTEKYKQGNKSYEKTTTENISIVIPDVVYRRQMGARGGLMLKGMGITFGDDGIGTATGFSSKRPYEFGTYNSTALYGGLIIRNTVNLVIKSDKYGLNSTGSHTTSWFADAILSPINRFKHPTGDDIDQLAKDYFDSSPIGFRVGYQANAIEKRSITGKKFGMAVRGELGHKPYTGWYGMATIGLTLIKVNN